TGYNCRVKVGKAKPSKSTISKETKLEEGNTPLTKHNSSSGSIIMLPKNGTFIQENQMSNPNTRRLLMETSQSYSNIQSNLKITITTIDEGMGATIKIGNTSKINSNIEIKSNKGTILSQIIE